MIIVQHCSHSKQFNYMQYISGVSFFRLYFKSFKPLYAPKEILILEEISQYKIFVLLF
jgi:hypothetical protein